MKHLEELISEKYDYADIDASLPACRLYAQLGYQTVDRGIWECRNGAQIGLGPIRLQQKI